MRSLPLFVLCVAVPALTLCVGCGGGGDPQPDAGTPYVPPPDAGPPDAGGTPDAGPVDLVPPLVTSYSPAHNAIAVDPASLIEVEFSEPMQTARGALVFQPSFPGVPSNGVVNVRPEDWDITRRKVTLSFAQGLPLLERVMVTISGFADVAGNPMTGNVTFAFTVSDGQPPRVSSASPAEGASQVALTLPEVVFNFNEPMDTTAGTLTPGGGFTLGTATWVGNQSIKAPVTGGLVYNGIYSVSLEGFRNLIGKPLDGSIYLGDGKLDFGTGPDITPPTVAASSPAEGAVGVLPENTSFIVITFSEPMDKAVGVGKLVDVTNGNATTVLTPNWSEDGFKVTYDVTFQLRHNATLRVDLTGFMDRSGNALNATAVLGSNGALDFATAVDTVKPAVFSSTPAEGAQDVYPVEVYATGTTPAFGHRKVFTFHFSEPMDTSISRVVLNETYNPGASRNLDGVWSADRLTLTVTFYPAAVGQEPLLSEWYYNVDLTGLKDRNGNFLDAAHPVLGNGRLDFHTLLNDTVLNHACQHALGSSITSVTATGSSAGPPRTDTYHARYEVTLPSNGTSYSGYTRMDLNTEEWQSIFLDRDVPVAVTNAANGANLVVHQVAVPPACPGITHRARFETPLNPTVHVRFGPILDSKFRFVLEQFY